MWRILAWTIVGAASGLICSRRIKQIIVTAISKQHTFHSGRFHQNRFFPAVVVSSTTLIYVGLVARFENNLDVLAFSFFASALVVHFFVDLDTHLLLLRVSTKAALLGLPIIVISAIVQHHASRLLAVLIGAFAMWSVLLILERLSRGGLGKGDVSLAPLLGAFIGYLSVMQVFIAIVMSFVIAGVCAVTALALRRITMRSHIAFGPFLAIGTQLTVFVGAPIMRWWLG